MKRKKKQVRNLIVLANVILALVYLLPLYWNFITSIKEKNEIYTVPPTLIPQSFTWSNYVKIFTEKGGAYLGYFLNSVQIDLLTVLLVCVISVIAGYGFSKLEIYGKRIFMGLILATIMVPFQALMIPLYTMMSDLHLLNTKACMIIIYVTFQSPFCIYMMKSAFDMIPKELREAALIDGAGDFTCFTRVYMPLVIPSAVTCAVYAAYNTWNDYLIALVFAGSSTKTFNVGLVGMAIGEYGTDWGLLTAGSFIGLIPIMLLFLILQKYFVKGMMSGAIK